MVMPDFQIYEMCRDDRIVDLELGAEPDFDRYSQIQPASLDLTVGRVFIPGAKPGKPGSATKPITESVLKPGCTAVVYTHETIQMPPFLCGLCFPPDHMSSFGILMTNPGHVDPGFVGKLRFTLINMSEEDFILRPGKRIATLMLLRVEGDSARDYAQRWGAQVEDEEFETRLQELLRRLTQDFLSVQERAHDEAKRVVSRVGVGLGLTTILATLALSFAAIGWDVPKTDTLSNQQARQAQTIGTLQTEIRSLTEQVSELHLRLSSGAPATSSAP